MKTINLDAPGDRSLGIVRGHVGPNRAGTPGATLVDANGNSSTQPEVHFTGATVINGDGYTQVIIGSGLGWFDVTNPLYGAQGDGTTDDTAAINLAIAALVAAGSGVLYFPAGTYKTTGGLTTISVPCTVMGDGSGLVGASTITCTSQTAVLFTTTAPGTIFRSLTLDNTYAGTASAGAAIVATNVTWNEYEDLWIRDFYTGIDIEDSLIWAMRRCGISDVHKYGVRIRNTAVPDGGDWTISDSWFGATAAADAGIRIESSGGGKITNCKINGGTGTSNFTYGIDLAVATSVSTAILLISNCSIEGVNTHGIRGTTSSGTSNYADIEISNCQFTTLGNSGKAISLVGNAAGDFYHVIVHGCQMGNVGTARPAMQFTNCDKVVVTAIILEGFNAFYTATTCTNFHDYTTGIGQVDVAGTPSAGQVITATSTTTANWQTPSSGSSGELDYAQDTTGTITINQTVEASATTIVTGNAVTYDGSTTVMVQFFIPDAQAPSTANGYMIFILFDGSSAIGWLALLLSVDTSPDRHPINAFRRLTPSAGSHTYSIRAIVSAGSSVVNDGAGGAGAEVPAFIRITRA